MAVKTKSQARSRRHARLRKKIVGSAERPRLVVTRSARHVFVQIVDDSKGHTVASASTLETDLRGFDGDKTAKARKVGELLAERAKAAAKLAALGGTQLGNIMGVKDEEAEAEGKCNPYTFHSVFGLDIHVVAVSLWSLLVVHATLISCVG